MPSAKPQPRPRGKSRTRKRKKRRGPLMRFRFSHVILIWIFCLIIAFVLYMFSRNLHPERDVFLTKERKGESSVAAPVIVTDSSAENVNSTASLSSGGENSTAAGDSEDEPAVILPTKVNPVPEGETQPVSYLKSCAFVGETDIYNMGKAELIGVMNTYAAEELRLNNYGSVNVMLDDTKIHIQSALYAANCPIYLMFGTEDLLEQPADQTADQFSVLLNTMKAAAPESEIYVLAIPPVTAAGEKVLPNSTIDEYNSLLLQAANDANVYYIDTNTALKNNDSRLSDQYALEDGIHLTAEAAQILLNYVLCHVPET